MSNVLASFWVVTHKIKTALEEIDKIFSKAVLFCCVGLATPIYTNSVWRFMNFCGVS